MNASEHQHLESPVSMSPRWGNGDYILHVMVIYHETMRGATLFIQSLVNTTSPLFAMVETTAVVELE